jgi:hypothetical protein
MLKRILFAALVASLAPAGPVAADDYSQIPAKIRGQIKAKCVARYPDDYMMQDGCIMVQSESYVKVHGGEAPAAALPEMNLDGIPSAFDQAQMNNSAYLSVVKSTCKVDVGTMPDQYRERAIASDRLDAKQVRAFIAQGVKEQQRAAKKDQKGFCAQAKANFQNFVDDLER